MLLVVIDVKEEEQGLTNYADSETETTGQKR